MLFFDAKGLKVHIQNVHDKIKLNYKCNFCEKSYSYASLKYHINAIHESHKANVNKCEYCGKSFTIAGSLKKHIYTVHEGHKDYKCESCGKSFNCVQYPQ